MYCSFSHSLDYSMGYLWVLISMPWYYVDASRLWLSTALKPEAFGNVSSSASSPASLYCLVRGEVDCRALKVVCRPTLCVNPRPLFVAPSRLDPKNLEQQSRHSPNPTTENPKAHGDPSLRGCSVASCELRSISILGVGVEMGDLGGLGCWGVQDAWGHVGMYVG